MVELQGSQYVIVKSINDLPPRFPKVIKISTDPTEINLVEKFRSIAMDVQVSNKGGSQANVSLNGEIAYQLASGSDQTHNNVQVSSIKVTGITSGFIIVQLSAISELQKLGAVEVR